MTTYRLTDGVEVTPATDTSLSPMCVWVVHPTLGLIAVDRQLLTEVGPPEPGCGAVVLDSTGDAWQRRGEDEWEMTGAADPYTWKELLLTFGPLRLLVPSDLDTFSVPPARMSASENPTPGGADGRG